jgi:hypothetical protein
MSQEVGTGVVKFGGGVSRAACGEDEVVGEVGFGVGEEESRVAGV